MARVKLLPCVSNPLNQMALAQESGHNLVGRYCYTYLIGCMEVFNQTGLALALGRHNTAVDRLVTHFPLVFFSPG